MGLNLNAGQKRGAIAISLAFVLTVTAGIVLSLVGANWDFTTTIIGALIIFLVLSPIYGYGIYTFARYSQEEAPNEDMTLGRQIIDNLLEKKANNIKDLVKILEVDSASIKAAINDLSRLELFNGFVNWETGEILLLGSPVVAALEQCQVCGNPIIITHGVTVCQSCRTEYYQY